MAKRGIEQCLTKWSPTAQYLSSKLEGVSFEIVPLTFEKVHNAVEKEEVDFILANPSYYVELESYYKVSRIVTMVNLHLGKPQTKYSGIIFHLAKRDDIKGFKDFKGKNALAVNERSFGGWRISYRKLKESGIDPYSDFKSLQFAGTHDSVVYAVQKGIADVGFVRTEILERMAVAGKIRLDDFKIICENVDDSFNSVCLRSTRSYPEWPIAKTNHVSDQLAKKVVVALLEMSQDNPAAKAASIAGWTVPLNYQSVHECLKYLQVSPYKNFGRITLSELFRQYWGRILFLLLLVSTLIFSLLRSRKLNKKLHLSNKKTDRELSERIKAETALAKAHDELEDRVVKRTAQLEKSTIALTEEISVRKEVENKLLKSKEHYSRLSELTYEGILIHKDGVLIDVNSALEKMFGYSGEELLGKNIIELIVPPKHHKIVFEMMQKDIAAPYEVEGIRKDGSIIQIEIESKTYDYEDNRQGVRVTAIRDITQRKKSELEILKLTNAVEQSPVSIVITNIDGNIKYVNPKFTEITGYTFEEAYNQNPRVLKSGEHPDEYYKNLWDTILSGNIWSGEFHNKKKNGELFWESAIISPVKDEDGEIVNFIAVKEDITEKKALLDELINSKEKAENADKMKSIFLAQMSHEIRTPINALVSMSSLLRYDFEESADEDQLMSFDIIDRAGGRIIRTVDLLLNLAEIQAGTYETHLTKFDILSDVISQIIAENKILAKNKNIDLHLIHSVENSELVADHYTVNQIFTQLINNAIKYTEEGEVSVEILLNESDQLVVEIKDTGIGIEESYLSNLFEPFSQEDMGYTRKFEGNGIGLALVNKYCELNNIKIEIESEKGVGSLFRVIFN